MKICFYAFLGRDRNNAPARNGAPAVEVECDRIFIGGGLEKPYVELAGLKESAKKVVENLQKIKSEDNASYSVAWGMDVNHPQFMGDEKGVIFPLTGKYFLIS